MRINSSISVLKHPDILYLELELLIDEYKKIEDIISNNSDQNVWENLNKKKGDLVSKINHIVDYVINEGINVKTLLDACSDYCSYRIDILSKNHVKNNKKINSLEEQIEKLKNVKSYKYQRITSIQIDDLKCYENEKVQLKETNLPKVDNSEMLLYQRFKHEDSSLLNTIKKEEKIQMNEKEMIYKEDYFDNYLECFEFNLEPKYNCYKDNKKLPEKIVVGRLEFENKVLFTNILKSGNIWIETKDKFEDKELIDNFIISYMFKILEQFPLGRVQFFLLDKENNWYFTKFKNNMNSDNANYLCKNTINIYNDSNVLSYIENSKCVEIAKKLTCGINNIFDLCNEDIDETIKFVIIRDNIEDLDDEKLKILLSLIRVNNTAHRCGYRFVIVTENNKNSNIKIKNEILKNCDIQYRIDEQTFKLGDELIKPIQIETDLNNYIDKATSILFKELKSEDSRYIKYKDIFPIDAPIEKFDSSIIKIPIGKQGSKVYELPFSSANEDRTPEGECVNYMVIGSTGSGKSSFMHSVVVNGSRKYEPTDLRFWILDFKDGKESEKYKLANIPHIEYLVSRNTQEDAIYIFKMILSEIAKREKLFGEIKDIHQYNKKMDNENKPHIPHIIVIIDEAQELGENKNTDYYNDNVGIIRELIRETSSKIRAFGIHLVLIAQNLLTGSGNFTSYYLPQVRGKISFSLNEEALTNSDFGSCFTEMKNDISNLSVGEAYIGIGNKSSLDKVRFAYDDLNMDTYFDEIREKFSKYMNMKTKIVGEVSKLYSFTKISSMNYNNYNNIIKNIPKTSDYIQKAIIGENSYSLEPFELDFNPNKESSILILGGTNIMATSIFKSLSKSLVDVKNQIYIINGDKSSYVDNNGLKQGNILTKYCLSKEKLAKNLKPEKEIKSIIQKIYNEYLDRKDRSSSSIEEIEEEPIYLFLNDINKFDKLNNLEMLFDDNDESDEELIFNTNNEENPGDCFLREAEKNIESDNKKDPINIINALNELIKLGYKFSIYIVISIIGSMKNNIKYIPDSFSKFIIYNDIKKEDIPDVIGYLGKIQEILFTLKNDGLKSEETRALYICNNEFIKIRPVFYEFYNGDTELGGSE